MCTALESVVSFCCTGRANRCYSSFHCTVVAQSLLLIAAGEPLQSSQQQQQPGIATAAKLEPVYLNRTVQTMLDCRDHEEYTFTMDKQLTRNPMLAMLFENCVQRLLAGKVTTVRQYTPMFSSPNSVHPTAQAKFVNLQV